MIAGNRGITVKEMHFPLTLLALLNWYHQHLLHFLVDISLQMITRFCVSSSIDCPDINMHA